MIETERQSDSHGSEGGANQSQKTICRKNSHQRTMGPLSRHGLGLRLNRLWINRKAYDETCLNYTAESLHIENYSLLHDILLIYMIIYL